MVCIFLEIPYERQLRKIDETSIENFLTSLKKECIDNGGNLIFSQSGLFFCFSEKCIAYLYSASRFLFNLNKILNIHKRKISEVRCIIDFFDNEFSSQDLTEYFQNYKKYLIPAVGIFASKSTAEQFKCYIKFDLNNEPIPVCKDFIFFNNTQVQNNESFHVRESLIVHRNDNYFTSIYNFIISHPIHNDVLNSLSEEDKISFSATQNSYNYLKKHRFLKQYPQYFIDAFLLNAGIYLNTYVKFKKIYKPLIVYIDNIDDEKNYSEAEKIKAAYPYIEIRELSAKLPSIYNIPKDLLELIYLILISSKYFFYDELDLFLLSLNKSSAFFDDVYSWLYQSGIIVISENIYSSIYGVAEIIDRRIGHNKKNILEYIGNFLWKMYESGSLYVDSTLEEVFTNLLFNVNPNFKLASFFHVYSDYSLKNVDLKKYKELPFFEPLKYYKTAVNTQGSGNFGKSKSLARSVISIFQEQKLESGEFRSLSLLAFLSLSENKRSDALTYFSYALNNAKQSNDTYFICEALFNIAVVYFLQNNLKQTIIFLEKLSTKINDSFEQIWKIPCLFMQGRTLLRLGNFKQAEYFFNRAADFASLYFENMEAVCRVWAFRSVMYAGKVKIAQENFLKFIDTVDDAVLFLLESYLINFSSKQEFNNLEININSLYNYYMQIPFYDIKTMPSGFCYAEDLILYKSDRMSTGKKLFNAFYNYYNYKINFSKLNSNDLENFILELESSAMDAMYQNDPFTPLYLYLCYDIFFSIKKSSESQIMGYLSKAFNALQKTVLAISENDIRDQYMQNNFWNSKIFKAAQEHEFI